MKSEIYGLGNCIKCGREISIINENTGLCAICIIERKAEQNLPKGPSSAERSAHPVLGDVLADFDSIIVSETENFIKFDKMQFHIMIRKYFA